MMTSPDAFSYSESQELYLMCKMMISPAIFFTSSKFFFFLGFTGGVKEKKMTHTYQFQSVTLYISETVDHIIKIFDT